MIEKGFDLGRANTKLQQRYDKIAKSWNSEAYEGTRRDDLVPSLIEISEVKNGQKVLEAMSGTAILSQTLKKDFPDADVTVLDFSQGMLDTIGDDIKKVKASAACMPFSNENFDRIFVRSALYDLPKEAQVKVLEELARVLAKDGIIVLQTYCSDSESQRVLNDIVNKKDAAAGQFQDIDGSQHPRYFATKDELQNWFEEAELSFEERGAFKGKITYLKTGEMSKNGTGEWLGYVDNLSADERAAINLREENDGTITYDFPGVIYRLKKENKQGE